MATLITAILWFFRGLAILYGLQMVVVFFWEFVPMERRDFQGARHEIYRGFGLPFGFIPLIGASAAVKMSRSTW